MKRTVTLTSLELADAVEAYLQTRRVINRGEQITEVYVIPPRDNQRIQYRFTLE